MVIALPGTMFCKMLGSLNSWKLPMIEKITVMASEPFSSGSLILNNLPLRSAVDGGGLLQNCAEWCLGSCKNQHVVAGIFPHVLMFAMDASSTSGLSTSMLVPRKSLREPTRPYLAPYTKPQIMVETTPRHHIGQEWEMRKNLVPWKLHRIQSEGHGCSQKQHDRHLEYGEDSDAAHRLPELRILNQSGVVLEADELGAADHLLLEEGV